MRVLAVFSRKGGVGKTTLTVNLAACFAEAGESVLVCDMDPQASATHHLGVPYPAPAALRDFHLGESGAEPILVRHSESLWVLPSSPHLAGLELDLVPRMSEGTPFRDAIAALEGRFRWILVDTPPAFGAFSVSALAAAEGVLLPATPEPASVDVCAQSLDLIQSVRRRLNVGLRVLGVVLNRVEPRLSLARQIRERIEALDVEVLAPAVRKSVRLAEAFDTGSALVALQPEHSASRDLRAVAKEVRRRVDTTL